MEMYLRQALNKGVYVGCLGCHFYLFLSDGPAVVSVRDVLGQAAIEQHRFLRYDANLSAQPVDVQLSGVVFVQHLANKTRWKLPTWQTWDTQQQHITKASVRYFITQMHSILSTCPRHRWAWCVRVLSSILSRRLSLHPDIYGSISITKQHKAEKT